MRVLTFPLNNAALYVESDYAFDGLRTYSSSSEDENAKFVYIGPPNLKKKRKNMGLTMEGD